jgi:hypothetical protein
MISAQELDEAVAAGAATLGQLNRRLVRCAVCAVSCHVGEAVRLHLRNRWGRGVWVCVWQCVPRFMGDVKR